jgi:hypothetical protein
MQILRFSVQLQHVPTPIYSVYGMYRINSELLAAVMCILTTSSQNTDYAYLSDDCVGYYLHGHNNAIPQSASQIHLIGRGSTHARDLFLLMARHYESCGRLKRRVWATGTTVPSHRLHKWITLFISSGHSGVKTMR